MAKNSPDEGKSTKMVEKQVDPSFNNLKEYRAKRQFSETPEPMADTVETPSRIPVFVVQKHEASHFHFDFRLEVDGVLKSWVVPKGPSMNPKDKRLAIQAEDHPLSYAHFEGVIPEGNYGAGTVEIWDSGTYAYVGNNRNISAAIKNGILEFKLHGHKLKGLFTLIHTNMDDQDRDWLLIKKDDVFLGNTYYYFDVTQFMKDELGTSGKYKHNLQLVFNSDDYTKTLRNLTFSDTKGQHPITLQLNYKIYESY